MTASRPIRRRKGLLNGEVPPGLWCYFVLSKTASYWRFSFLFPNIPGWGTRVCDTLLIKLCIQRDTVYSCFGKYRILYNPWENIRTSGPSQKTLWFHWLCSITVLNIPSGQWALCNKAGQWCELCLGCQSSPQETWKLPSQPTLCLQSSPAIWFNMTLIRFGHGMNLVVFAFVIPVWSWFFFMHVCQSFLILIKLN